MDRLNEEELDALSNDQLVSRMDGFLTSSFQKKMAFDILKLNVRSLYETKTAQHFEKQFQRALIYKTFGFLLQLQYTSLATSAHFHRIPDINYTAAKQLNFAARNQWCSVSSRIAFEYFMHLTYMLGTGKKLETKKSIITKYKKCLKEDNNPYTYFAFIAAQARDYDSVQRTPEVHAGTKYTRRILLMSADNTDESTKNFHLLGTLKGQWQYVLKIADGSDPDGWSSVGINTGTKEWHKLYESTDRTAINTRIDEKYF